MSAPMSTMGREALNFMLRERSLIVDVGAGGGEHTRWFEDRGHDVMAIDHKPEFPGCIEGLWPIELDYIPDAIWMAHVLEHQPNPGDFLNATRLHMEPGGLLAVTVPPLKHEIVGGHVTLWNAGLLLYQLILAGFDCSQASVLTYGYNITVIVPRAAYREEDHLFAIMAQLNYDHGDIELLADFFPLPVAQGFDGQIAECNWP